MPDYQPTNEGGFLSDLWEGVKSYVKYIVPAINGAAVPTTVTIDGQAKVVLANRQGAYSIPDGTKYGRDVLSDGPEPKTPTTLSRYLPLAVGAVVVIAVIRGMRK